MKLQAARTQKGLKQRDLAKRAGVSQQVISRIETGQTKDAGYGAAMRIARVLLGPCPRCGRPNPSEIAEFSEGGKR